MRRPKIHGISFDLHELPKTPKIESRKWGIFRVTSFHSLMYPCITCNQILGTFPYEFTSSDCVTSKIMRTYATLVTVVYIVCGLFLLYEIDVSGNLEYDMIPGDLQGNCYLVAGIYASIVTCASHRRKKRILKNLLDLSSNLPPEAFGKIGLLVHIKDILGYVFLIAQIPNLYSHDPLIIVLKIISMYTTLIIFSTDMLYTNCVLTLKVSYAEINRRLMRIRNILKEDQPHLLRRIYHEKINPSLLVELKELKRIHWNTGQILKEINSTFFYQLFGTLLLTFVEITFSLYFYILQRFSTLDINLERQIWYCYYITAVAYYSLKIVHIVLACHTTTKEAVQIEISIYEIVRDVTDKQIKDELKLFILQTLQYTNQFSARGIIIDTCLLTQIIRSISTYLLILIQFLINNQELTDEDCNPVYDLFS